MAVMSNDESQMVAFNLILNSGNARTLLHEGMDALREHDFELADQKFEEADAAITEAHKAQTDLLQAFAGGTEILIEIIMVHAQDHLMTTMTLKEVAMELKEIYKQLDAMANA